MNFHWRRGEEIELLSIEAQFTLLDFILLFACLMLGFVLSGIFLAFAVAYIVKIFTRREFEFDLNSNQLRQFFHTFGLLRIKLRDYPFTEIQQITFTNYDMGNPFWPVSWINQQTYSIIIECENTRILVAKVQEEQKDFIGQLFEEMKSRLFSHLLFNSEFLD